jgi:hypothetical protein
VFLVWIAANKGLTETERWHDTAGYVIVGLVFLGTIGVAALLGRQKVEGRKAKVENRAAEQTPNAAAAEVPSSNLQAPGNLQTPNSKLRTSDSENSSLVTRHWSLPHAHSSFGIRHFNFPPSTSYFLLPTFIYLLAVEFAAAGWYWAHEKNLIAHPTWRVQWPQAAPGYHEINIPEGVRGTLRYDEGREAMWQSRSEMPSQQISSPVYLFFFRWDPGSSSVVRARAHRPDICLPSIGWHQLADRGVRNYKGVNGVMLPARHITFTRDGYNVVAHTFFCLQEDQSHPNEPRPDLEVKGGAQPDWSMHARTQMVKNGVRNLGQQVLEVVILTPSSVSDDAAEEEFANIVKNVIVPR